MTADEVRDWRPARVVENRSIARGSWWLTLEASDDRPAAFEPGHVLGLRVDLPGGEALRHAYTVSQGEAPRRRFAHLYRVIQGGRMSQALMELKPGDPMHFHGPGHSPIRSEINASARRIFGLATGTGLGPLYGYAAQTLAAGEARPIALWAGMRERSDICLDEELKDLERRHSNLSHGYTLSQPDDAWRAARGLCGRLQESLPALLRQAGSLEESHFHLVGNGEMVLLWRAALRQIGVPKKNVSIETYFNHHAEPGSEDVLKLATNLQRAG